jgi:hypothetical protein
MFLVIVHLHDEPVGASLVVRLAQGGPFLAADDVIDEQLEVKSTKPQHRNRSFRSLAAGPVGAAELIGMIWDDRMI